MSLIENKINIEIAALLGEIEMNFRDFIALDVGSTINLEQPPENKVKITANGQQIGEGSAIRTANHYIGVVLHKKL